MDMKKLDKAARTVQLPDTAASITHNSRLSFSIVNGGHNGKRVKFSKRLAEAVAITKSAAMLPIQEEGLLMVAEKLPYEATCTVALRDERGAKIAYNAGMVALLTQIFGLNFADHTSMSFTDITFDALEDGTPVALIPIYNKYPINDGDADEEE